MRKTICIYHANCMDGFAAAWAVRSALGPQIEFHASDYGDTPPDVADADVVVVDFSYKRMIIEQMAKVAHSVLILDHHVSAQDELAGLPSAPFWDAQRRNGGVAAVFDMERSGAQIAWDFFRSEYQAQRPSLIDYIADRDLWRFDLPDSKAINAALSINDFDFHTWTDLATDMQDAAYLQKMREHGATLLKRKGKDVAQIINTATRHMTIGGHIVPVANCPIHLASDVAGALAESAAFGACYFDNPKGRKFSLRANSDEAAVHVIAGLYGGGGHPRAAGFMRPHGWEGDSAVSIVPASDGGAAIAALDEKVSVLSGEVRDLDHRVDSAELEISQLT